MKFNLKYHLLLWLALPFIFNQCANPVSPVGGPKDITPPRMVLAEPPLYQTNFENEKIRIYFNEYIELKEVQKQVIISPPMTEQPEFKIRGKSLLIELNEPLKDSTTYNIFMGNAIVDITEGNPATNFQYVFSTWDVVDSLSLEGNVKDAFTLEPVAGVNIMLYLDNNDTLPFDSLPYYIRPYFMSRTNDSGNYRLNNLPDKDFMLFALEDGNSNLIFDQPSERVAFLDSLIHPYYIEPPVEILPDSLMADSLGIMPDSLEISSIIKRYSSTIVADSLYVSDSLAADSVNHKQPFYSLRLFQELDSIQRFIKVTLVKNNQLMFVFKRPAIHPEIRFLNVHPGEYAFLEEWNTDHDTLTHWITHTEKDTLIFAVKDKFMDFDTVEVSLRKKLSRKEEKESEKISPLKYKIINSTPDLDKALKISFAYPIAKIDTSGFFMVEGEDTLGMHIQFTDSIKRKAEINRKWIEKTFYHLIIPDSAFTDILDQSNDTIDIHFTTKSPEDYGNLFLNLSVPDSTSNYIVRLMQKDKIIREQSVDENSKLSFKYLLPGDYIIKIIEDKNKNGKWDTGDYIQHIQPETVLLFDKVITVRANWDIEEDWNL